MWGTFKKALCKVQSGSPLVASLEEKDWVIDEVSEVSKKKQEVWMRLVKFPSDGESKRAYQELKVLSRKCADRPREEWWEAKAAEAQWLHEIAVSLGRGGSLLKDLNLLRCKQNLKADTALVAQDGLELHNPADKLES